MQMRGKSFIQMGEELVMTLTLHKGARLNLKNNRRA